MKDPTANFRNAFSGSSKASPYGATNALVKVMFSYAGYENAFNVVNEVKNPVKTLRWSAPVSLTITAVLYILANVAYFSAATTDEILKSENTAASVFFENVFGSGGASRALNCLICLSAFGNLLAVLIGQSRMLRECGRSVECIHPHALIVDADDTYGIDKAFSLGLTSGHQLGPSELLWVRTL